MSREWYQRIRNGTGRMQELQYRPKHFGDAYTTQFLQQVIPTLPELVSFHLCLTNFDNSSMLPSQGDLTNAVITLLGNAPHLERLRVKGLQLDIPLLSQALRTNNHLKSFCNQGRKTGKAVSQADTDACLELLKDHNVFLIECTLGGVEQEPRTQYYLDLNRLGRDQARRATKGQDLKELVLTAWNDCVLESRLKGEHEISAAKQGMVYGLLREAPSLWCRDAAVL